MSLICPLCESNDYSLYYEGNKRDKHRKYYNCKNCDLIFVNKESHLNQNEELNRYKEHNNSDSDDGYRKFISRLYYKIEPFIDKSMMGLDYGCGPGPVLSMIFSENEYNINIYDPFFHNNKDNLDFKYDFITCTEVVEHFYEPRKEFDILDSLLKTNGVLGIMTSFTDGVDFNSWHYKNDETHVVFYSKKTVSWISDKYDWNIRYIDKSIVIFSKN